MAGHRLHRAHVDGVDIGALLAVDLDRDEPVVHEARGFGVFEGLVLHHVTPVARRVPDREQDRLILSLCARERLVAPGVPVDGVVRVLQEVGARFACKTVRHRVSS